MNSNEWHMRLTDNNKEAFFHYPALLHHRGHLFSDSSRPRKCRGVLGWDNISVIKDASYFQTTICSIPAQSLHDQDVSGGQTDCWHVRLFWGLGISDGLLLLLVALSERGYGNSPVGVGECQKDNMFEDFKRVVRWDLRFSSLTATYWTH